MPRSKQSEESKANATTSLRRQRSVAREENRPDELPASFKDKPTKDEFTELPGEFTPITDKPEDERQLEKREFTPFEAEKSTKNELNWDEPTSASLKNDQDLSHAKRPHVAERPLRVAAFNLQIFGDKKVAQSRVVDILIKIISRYDLVLLQEIRDKDKTSIDTLVSNLNKADPQDPFYSVESERLGRTDCKEQFVFLYRSSRVTVSDTYQYDDGVDNGRDAFHREPFAARFRAPLTDLEDFAIIAVHTDPEDAAKEIGAMHKVYDATKAYWNLEDILIAGDFNADGAYVNKDDWAKITLRSDARFKWLLGDDVDTTVGVTERAYDRFVVAGKKLIKSVVPGSAKVFRFDDELGLTKEQAEQISDHYPIEIQLYGKVNESVIKKTSTGISVFVKQATPLNSVNDARKIYRANEPDETAGFEILLLHEGTAMYQVHATKKNVGPKGVVRVLKDFQRAFPEVLHDETICMVAAYMDSSFMTSPVPVYGLLKQRSNSFDVTVIVSLREPILCEVVINKLVTQHYGSLS